MIDPAKLAEWEWLAEGATPGPWHLTKAGDQIIQTAHVTRDVWTIPHRDGDMAFIAASREALPALIAEVRRLQNEAAKEAYIADVYRRKAEELQAENAELRRET